MKRCFKLLRFFLIGLIGIAILNDIGAYLYVVFVGYDTSDYPFMIIEVLTYLFAGYLIFLNKIFGNILICFLSLLSLKTALELDHSFFAQELLKFAPQVIFRNILMIALLISAVVHFTLLLIRKTQN